MSHPSGLRTSGERERGKNKQESRRRTHQAAAGRRQFSASRRGGGLGAAQRGASAATTTNRDTTRGPAARRGLAETCQGATARSRLASACWGEPGSGRRTWAMPPVLTAWRAARRRPGGSEVSGAVGLLWQRHGCPPARQRLLRGDRGNVTDATDELAASCPHWPGRRRSAAVLCSPV